MKPRWPIIIVAFLAAALTGSFALSIEAAVLLAVEGLGAGFLGPVVVLVQAVVVALTGVFVVAPVFLIGLVLVGGPAWLIIAATQIRSRTAATVMGAGLAGLVAGGILLAFGFVAGGGFAFGGAVLLIPGAVAGWTLHRVAYGRNPKG